MGIINCVKDLTTSELRSERVYKFTLAPSHPLYAMLSTADRLLSLEFNFISLKLWSKMTSVFQLLLQIILSLITTVAPCNTKDFGGGVLHPYQWKGVHRSPHFRQEKEYIWAECDLPPPPFLPWLLPVYHSQNNPLSVRTSLRALFTHYFILHHIALGNHLESLFLDPFTQ